MPRGEYFVQVPCAFTSCIDQLLERREVVEIIHPHRAVMQTHFSLSYKLTKTFILYIEIYPLGFKTALQALFDTQG
ncbi:hypothetical protein SDC9_99687 [bioreactor metagenome]|uniref:Uncharacterized protein n=1 Tax=bioreactor metagenome TaxID=1076179 RepID=A0A645APY6_9ZZZZ